jgi:hypothetical protein
VHALLVALLEAGGEAYAVNGDVRAPVQSGRDAASSSMLEPFEPSLLSEAAAGDAAARQPAEGDAASDDAGASHPLGSLRKVRRSNLCGARARRTELESSLPFGELNWGELRGQVRWLPTEALHAPGFAQSATARDPRLSDAAKRAVEAVVAVARSRRPPAPRLAPMRASERGRRRGSRFTKGEREGEGEGERNGSALIDGSETSVKPSLVAGICGRCHTPEAFRYVTPEAVT